MVLTTSVLMAMAVILMACESDDKTGDSPNVASGSSLVSPRLEEWPNQSEDKSNGGGTDILVNPDAEYRPCNGTVSIYTVEDGRGVGIGAGRTRSAAAESAVKDAIDSDVRGQFRCQLCPDEYPCGEFIGRIDTGGAFLEDPAGDCEFLEGQWHCFGWVDFGSDSGGPPASAEGGCKVCPADVKPIGIQRESMGQLH